MTNIITFDLIILVKNHPIRDWINEKNYSLFLFQNFLLLLNKLQKVYIKTIHIISYITLILISYEYS